METFYDADGNAVKMVVHDGFIETDTNSVTGKTLPLSQTWVNTFDRVAGTRTVVGKALVMTDHGTGLVIQDTGRGVCAEMARRVNSSSPQAGQRVCLPT